MPRKAGRVPVSQVRGHVAGGRETGAAGFGVAPGAGAAVGGAGARAGWAATPPVVSDAGGAAEGVGVGDGAGDDGVAGADGAAGDGDGAAGAGATAVRTCHAAPGVAAVHVTAAAAPASRNDPSVTSIGARRPASSTTAPASGRAPSRAVP